MNQGSQKVPALEHSPTGSMHIAFYVSRAPGVMQPPEVAGWGGGGGDWLSLWFISD